MENKEILRKIDELRFKKGWSIYELAKRSNLMENTIYNWRKRNSCPNISTLNNVCKAFNITLAQFFSKENIAEVSPEISYLIANYSMLNLEQKNIISKLIEVMLKK